MGSVRRMGGAHPSSRLVFLRLPRPRVLPLGQSARAGAVVRLLLGLHLRSAGPHLRLCGSQARGELILMLLQGIPYMQCRL